MRADGGERRARATDAAGPRWLLYGAYGYTGRLILQRALSRGHRPTVAGRDAARVEELAGAHGLEGRCFALDDRDRVRRALAGHAAVVHAAGPFSATWRPMVDACLGTGCHYLDITGEIDVLESIHARDDEARDAGLHLIPGAGFDVVPTDCAAAMAAAACPHPVALDLAFRAAGGPSRGTARTALERLGAPGAVRRAGRIVPVATGALRRTIPFTDGPRTAVAIPWGDVSTAWHSTGIPDIRVFLPLPRGLAFVLAGAAPLLRTKPLRRLAGRLVDAFVAGPDAAARARGRSRVWAEARGAGGEVVRRELVTPNGYALTADAVVAALERVLAGEIAEPPGAHTPSRAFGADFVLSLDGVRLVTPPGAP